MEQYAPLTVNEVAHVLEITNCDELTGEQIAQEMLDGIIEFESDELIKLAKYKGVEIKYMIENDKSFANYYTYVY